MIETASCTLRPLNQSDVTERYLSWFRTSGAERISSAQAMTDLEQLRAYVASKASRPDVLFLGIFERATGRHVGNVKYEPVDCDHGFAVMGIFIGEEDARGKGVASEAIAGSAKWLSINRNIKQILLGVEINNEAALTAYGRVGFRIEDTPHLQSYPGVHKMILNIA